MQGVMLRGETKQSELINVGTATTIGVALLKGSLILRFN